MNDPQNPYAPPSGGQAQANWSPSPQVSGAPPQQRTSGPKVIGILSIVFASLTLLGGLFGSCMGALGGSMTSGMGSLAAKLDRRGADSAAGRRARAMMKHVGSLYKAIAVQSIIFAAMSGWLLAVGVGQLRYRRWAQKWSVMWSGAALVVLVGVMMISFFWIGPTYKAMFDDIARHAPSGAMPAQASSWISSLAGGASVVMTLIFYAPYPIIMLVYFTRDRVKEMMTA
ncbi:MAG: hypothetical protein KC503_22390 [Myxococcales bacterium]|nr:hypothetical protein [Myxococcales bacterium]